MLSGIALSGAGAAPCQCIGMVKPGEASERGLHFCERGGGRDLEHIIEGHGRILAVMVDTIGMSRMSSMRMRMI